MSTLLSTGVRAAAGYPQYSGNLIPRLFGQDLIEYFYCSTVFGDITTTDYIGELTKCGDTITFWRPPHIQVMDYVKDQTLKRQTFEMKPITLTIDKAKYFDFKIDHIDEKQICNWASIKSRLLESAARSAANSVDCDILGELFADANRCNRGATAGVQSKCYNLGDVGAPLVVTKANVLDVLLAMQAVLDEQCVPQEGRWIVVPPKFKNIILSSDLRSVCFSGLAQSTMLNGKMPDNIAGFDIYISNHVSQVVDPGTNQKAFNIMFGWKGSIVFASQLEKMREIDDANSFDTRHQGLMVYGYGTVHDEALGHLYATLA
jgi:hypothetical protein